jgi:hypothetical protein
LFVPRNKKRIRIKISNMLLNLMKNNNQVKQSLDFRTLFLFSLLRTAVSATNCFEQCLVRNLLDCRDMLQALEQVDRARCGNRRCLPPRRGEIVFVNLNVN